MSQEYKIPAEVADEICLVSLKELRSDLYKEIQRYTKKDSSPEDVLYRFNHIKTVDAINVVIKYFEKK